MYGHDTPVDEKYPRLIGKAYYVFWDAAIDTACRMNRLVRQAVSVCNGKYEESAGNRLWVFQKEEESCMIESDGFFISYHVRENCFMTGAL